MCPRISLLIVLVSVGFFQPVHAQHFSDRFSDILRTHLEFGIQGGASGYIGELNDQVYGFNSWTAGANAKYYFNPINQRDRTWGVRLDYNYLDLQGADRLSNNVAQKDRNFHFHNRAHELAAAMEFHFWEFRPIRGRNTMTTYVFAGVGGLLHNPMAEHPNRSGKVSLIDAMVEPRFDSNSIPKPRSKMTVVIPFGTGFKYNLSRSWTPVSIGVELNYRYTFSDFLDGAGDNPYISHSASRSRFDQAEWKQLAGPHTKLDYDTLVGNNYRRGNPGNDFFMTATFRVTYTLYKYRDPLWK